MGFGPRGLPRTRQRLKAVSSVLSPHMKLIGVIGSQHPTPAGLARAEEVGALVARRGAALICGGLTGVMEAACKGAKAEGGLTVGVLPTIRKADANPYVDVAIATGMGTARNVIIVRSADAVIAVDGRYGTLSEIAHAFEQGKRVISLGSWDMAKLDIPPALFVQAADPVEAVDLALQDAENPVDDPIF